MKGKSKLIKFRTAMIIFLILVMIAAFIFTIKFKRSMYSPKEFWSKSCEEKTWCLDYDTVAIKERSCEIKTSDCLKSERCLNGVCKREDVSEDEMS